MEKLEALSGPKALLLAINFAANANIKAFRLIALKSTVISLDIGLRILLTYLPGSTEPSLYTPLLADLLQPRRTSIEAPLADLDTTYIDEISEDEARKRIRAVHLLPLRDSSIADNGGDSLTLFLIHRAHQIDTETGLLALLPDLITPFTDHSQDIKSWLISTLLPLLRLSYEYYPEEGTAFSLQAFENLDDGSGIHTLLSRSSKDTVARDLRGLVGPWMYGLGNGKRRRLNGSPTSALGTEQSIGGLPTDVEKSAWECLFLWMQDKSAKDFSVVTEAIEGWDGPGDADYGGYQSGQVWLHEETQGRIELQYAQAALATLYHTTGISREVLEMSKRILHRISQLLDLDSPPGLDSLRPLPSLSISKKALESLTQVSGANFFQDHLLETRNPLTAPNESTISFLTSILLSTTILFRWDRGYVFQRAVQLCLLATLPDQESELKRLIHGFSSGKRTEPEWRQFREEVLWIWHLNRHGKDSDGVNIFGKFKEEFLEMEILKALLAASQFKLVKEMYSSPRSVSPSQIEGAVLETAMNFYDGASNGNKSRGGLKKADDTITAFYPSYFQTSTSLHQAKALINATHALSFYSLTLQHGIPFQPVNIRVNSDPISLIGKVLEQNPASYTRVDDLISIGKNLVDAGLVERSKDSNDTETEKLSQDAERRITGMAIETALASDDFDTAYSYVVNRLANDSAESTRTEDDISWRAAFQAGRHRPAQPIKSSTSDLRRVEMRMELLSTALLIAPPAALPEILGVWRRCEEELNVMIQHESQEEEFHDDKGDRKVPGQFLSASPLNTRREGGKMGVGEDAPMGLFDVARGAAAALSKSAFPLRGSAGSNLTKSVAGLQRVTRRASDGESINSNDGDGRLRKRDMVSNMVTGGLASGIGWVLGAQPVTHSGSHEG